MIDSSFFGNIGFVTESVSASRSIVSSIEDDIRDVRQLVQQRLQRRTDLEQLVSLLETENNCLKDQLVMAEHNLNTLQDNFDESIQRSKDEYNDKVLSYEAEIERISAVAQQLQTEKDTVLAQAKELETYCIGIEDELQLQQSQSQALAAENENLKLENGKLQEILNQLRVNRQPAPIIPPTTHINNSVQPGNTVKPSDNDTLLHDLMERISILERENSSSVSVQSSTQHLTITSLPPSPKHHTAYNRYITQHDTKQAERHSASKEKDYNRQQSFRFFEAQLEQRLSESDDDEEEEFAVNNADLDSLNDGDRQEEKSPDIYFVSSSSGNNNIYESQDQVNQYNEDINYHHEQSDLKEQQMRQFLSPPLDSDDENVNDSHYHQPSHSQQHQVGLKATEEDDLDSVQLSDLLQFKV